MTANTPEARSGSRRLAIALPFFLWLAALLVPVPGHGRLGAIEALFLFAPVVLVPLALDVASRLIAPSRASRLLDRILRAQPLAAWFAAAALFLPTGIAGGSLAAVWLLLCLATALAGLDRLVTLLWREPTLRPDVATACMGLIYLAVGGGWLLVSRAGLPSGFAEPIPLLTAVHFHYAGLVTLVIAAGALRDLGDEASGIGGLARLAAVGLVLAPPLVAAGFVVSFPLKLAGIFLQAASLIALGVVQLALVSRTRRQASATLLALSSAAGIAGMALAIAYGLGEADATTPIDMTTMALLHGGLNALGFSLCGLLFWRTRVVPADGEGTGPAPPPAGEAHPRWKLATLIVALALAVLAYKLLVHGRLAQTSALFVGLPALLAAALACTPSARTATGMVMKGTTIGLLLSGIVLGEGFICIVMAAPLFYSVGFAIGWAIDSRGRPPSRRTLPLIPLVLILPTSFEGVSEGLAFRRRETVVVERVIAASPAAVTGALAGTPRFDRPLPGFLRLGFPAPIAAAGSGLGPGSLRRIRFAGGNGGPSDLVLAVAASAPGRVRFVVVADSSPIAHWLAWREAEVRFEPAGAGRTRVAWTLVFDRRLDPALYFRPLERHGAGLAASYLIDAAATP